MTRMASSPHNTHNANVPASWSRSERFLRLTDQGLLHYIAGTAGNSPVSSSDLARQTGISLPTIKRMLQRLVAGGQMHVTGAARSTRYHLGPQAFYHSPAYGAANTPTGFYGAPSERRAFSFQEPPSVYDAGSQGHPQDGPVQHVPSIIWSPSSIALRAYLMAPLGSRPPVPYRRDLLDNYQPNTSSLLPHRLAQDLSDMGRLNEQLPAGTYVRKVLEQLLIDLSWSSSHLEGNRYSLLDTERLFKSGVMANAADTDTVMLLNHKVAIEFLVESVPRHGLNTGIICNLHSVLMRDLLADTDALGVVREKVAGIHATSYIPMQVPAVLHEMLSLTVQKAQQIRNPIEAAFFLWVHLAYLQAFEDGNKRVSRLAANIPLMLSNHSPLSFLNVDRSDYALAMMGFYERADVAMAADLFAWTYRQSHARYQAVLQVTGRPDAFRVRNRELLNNLMQRVVRNGMGVLQALGEVNIHPDDASRIRELLEQELVSLMPHNCARYRLSMTETQRWIEAGRPVGG